MTIHSVVIQKLLSTNAHLGRRVAAHHFKIYTYGSRNAMAIIDSDKTLICLRNACDFMGNLVRNKGKFLFVNTNQLFDEIIDQMTQKIGCKNDNSWRLGGFLTNSSSPKKFRSRNKKLILGSTQPPDCVVIMDTQRKSSVIFEADRLQIPIVGLVDSSMPWDIYKRITYPVPANDSVQFVYLFCNLITKTFLYEQKKFPAALGNATQVTKGEIRYYELHYYSFEYCYTHTIYIIVSQICFLFPSQSIIWSTAVTFWHVYICIFSSLSSLLINS